MPTPSFVAPPADGSMPAANVPVATPPPASLNLAPAAAPAAPAGAPAGNDNPAAPTRFESKPVTPPTEGAPAAGEEALALPPIDTPKGPEILETSPQDRAEAFAAGLQDAAEKEDEEKTKPKGKPAAKKDTEDLAKPEAAAPAAPESFDAKVKAAEDKLHPNTSISTKEVIKSIKASAQAEIAALNQKLKDADALKQKAAELEQKLTERQGELPEPVKKELEELRAFRRDADVTRDPEFVARYDGKISANAAKIEALFVGACKTAGVADDAIAKAVAGYKKDGFTLDNLSGEIAELQKQGKFAQAQRLTALLMENETLQEGRQNEIAEWQKDSAGRTLKQQEAQKQAQGKADGLMRSSYAASIAADTQAYSKDFPQIIAPPAPSATDAPEVQRAKQEALDGYTEAMTKARTEIESFFVPAKSQDELAVRNGKLYALAAVASTFKNLLAPALLKDLSALRSENAELKAKLASGKKAGDLSQRHVAEIAPTGKLPAGSPGMSTAEVFAQQLAATAPQQ